MMIERLEEDERQCGWREDGGMYLMGGKLSRPCGRLPFPIPECECCGRAWDHFRGIKRLNAETLMDVNHAPRCGNWYGRARSQELMAPGCEGCAMYKPAKRGWMMWVGNDQYTPTEFLAEAGEQGISKRIVFPPAALVFGLDVVYLAHKKAVVTVGDDGKPETSPGIMATFVPSHLDFVVGDDEKLTEQQERVYDRVNAAFELDPDGPFTRVVQVVRSTTQEELDLDPAPDG